MIAAAQTPDLRQDKSYILFGGFSDNPSRLGFLHWKLPPAMPANTPHDTERGTSMNAETASNPFPTSQDSQGASSTAGLNGDVNRVRKVAQSLHEAVDTLEQKIGMSSDKMMSLQQEYGDIAREQVRANPIAALGVAFAAGFVLAKLFSGR